jgi:WD40 repeat protein
VLVAGGSEGKIHNVFNRSYFGRGKEKKKAINDIKFLPSQEHVFAVASESGIYLCNLDTQVIFAAFRPLENAVAPQQIVTLSFSPTGDYIACSGERREIVIWNLSRNKLFQKSLVLSSQPNAKSSNVMFRTPLITVHSARVVRMMHNQNIDSLIWLGNDTVISKSAEGHIVIWQIKEKVVKLQEVYVPLCKYW